MSHQKDLGSCEDFFSQNDIKNVYCVILIKLQIANQLEKLLDSKRTLDFKNNLIFANREGHVTRFMLSRSRCKV